MEQQLLIAIGTGLGGMVGWGIADFFAKKTIDQLGDVQTLFWTQLVGIVPLIVCAACTSSTSPTPKGDWMIVAILGVWSGLSYIPTYVAFGKGKVSLLSPLFACYAVVVTLLSAMIFRESIPVARQIAFIVVFTGVVLITTDPKDVVAAIKRRQSRAPVDGVKEILLAVCLYSLWLVALDRFVSGRSWAPFLLGIRVCSAGALFLYAKASGRRLTVPERRRWPSLALIGCCDVAAFASVSAGFSQTGLVSVVAMISAAFSLPTIVLARAFLKERATMLQTSGSLLIVLGVVLVYAL